MCRNVVKNFNFLFWFIILLSVTTECTQANNHLVRFHSAITLDQSEWTYISKVD